MLSVALTAPSPTACKAAETQTALCPGWEEPLGPPWPALSPAARVSSAEDRASGPRPHTLSVPRCWQGHRRGGGTRVSCTCSCGDRLVTQVGGCSLWLRVGCVVSMQSCRKV